MGRRMLDQPVLMYVMGVALGWFLGRARSATGKPVEAPREAQATTLAPTHPQTPPAPTVALVRTPPPLALSSEYALTKPSRFGVPYAVRATLDYHGDPVWASDVKDDHGSILFRSPNMGLVFTHVTIEYDTGERRRAALGLERMLAPGVTFRFRANVRWNG